MSEFGVYYDNPSGILPVSNLHQGLTDEITYKDDAKLFDNMHGGILHEIIWCDAYR